MKIVSLFSGAGGLDLGLIQAGNEIIWANDIDSDSCETYSRNIGSHIVCKSISEIDPSQIPDCDAVVGGFPCQGFSMANIRRSSEDERNKLYKYFFNVILTKQPRYFLAENVRGILSLDRGNAIKRIVSDFESAGYRVKYNIFNVSDFGVPQHRIRVIISGTRKDLPESLNFIFPKTTHSRGNWVTIGEALEGIPEPESSHDLANHVCSKYKITNRNFTGHRKTDPNKPSPTILARGNGKGGVCAIQHPRNHRRMSVRESAIIQTFPLNFEFSGNLGSMYRQVGNAVPVLFGKKLGEKLRELEAVLI